MKLKNLFYLLLALPMVFAACEKSSEPEPQPGPGPEPGPEPGVEYVVDMQMVGAVRLAEIPELGLTFDENEFMLAFVDATKENALTLLIVDEEGNTTLQAGTYTSDDAVQLPATTFSQNGVAIEFTDANVVVALEGETYSIEAKFVDEKEQNYRFTFEGEIVDMTPEKPQPTTPKFELVSEQTMEFGQEQQLGTIEFKLENPVEGVEVSAKANAQWISNIIVKESTIEFVVAANDGAAREAKITATYGMLEFKVTVKQAEYVAPAPVIIIDAANDQFEAEGGNGEIAFRIENSVEGVEATATADVEWISIDSVANGIVAFTVAANETSAIRDGVITLTYGEISENINVKQFNAGYNPDLNYSTFVVTETWADLKQEGKQWNVTFVEHHETLGDMQTIISFYNEDANIKHLSSGSYSVANGTILLNSASQNGYSTYRGNSSDSTDIIDATFEVTADTDAHTITIVGSFQAANNVVSLSYTGAINGMDISEATTETINITDWKQFTGKYWNGYDNDSEFMFQGRSSDNSVEFMFDCYSFPQVSDKIAPEGTYVIAPWEAKDNYQGDSLYIMDQSYIIYNTIKGNLAEGTLTVTHMRGQYYIEFDFIDTLGRHFTGSYTGALTAGSTMNVPQ